MKTRPMKTKTVLLGSLLAVCVLILAGPAHAGLIAHWSLDEPVGTSGVDSILDSGPSASHHGTPDFQAGSPVTFGGAGATAGSGTSVEFDMGAIGVPYDAALNPASFTFSAWARPDASGGHAALVTSRHDANPALAGYILYNVNNNWSFWTGRPSGWDQVTSAGSVNVGAWQHLAISFDADTGDKTLYVDGTATTAVQQYTPNALRDLHFGGGGDLGNQYMFDGAMDDAALWSSALTQTDINNIIAGGAAAVPGGQVANWMLDEPAGTGGAGSVIDSVGGYNGNTPALPFAPGAPGANANTGTSIDFSNASINVPHDAPLNPDSFTATLWVKPDSAGGYQSALTNRNDVGPGVDLQGFILYNASGTWSFWTGDGDPGWPGLNGAPVEVGEWQHLAISFDADTNTKKIFFNGTETASAIDQGYVPNDLRELHIGGGGDLGVDFRFDGLIDDVGLWDRALSETEIQDVMANGVPEPSTVVLLSTLALFGLGAYGWRRR